MSERFDPFSPAAERDPLLTAADLNDIACAASLAALALENDFLDGKPLGGRRGEILDDLRQARADIDRAISDLEAMA